MFSLKIVGFGGLRKLYILLFILIKLEILCQLFSNLAKMMRFINKINNIEECYNDLTLYLMIFLSITLLLTLIIILIDK